MSDNLFIEFRKSINGKRANSTLIVPILRWLSGSETNIDICQSINRKFFNGNKQIFIDELILNNKLNHIIKYPKIPKDSKENKFFYADVCSFYDWTPKELEINMNVLNFRTLKPYIARTFGYSTIERKKIGLEAVKYDRKRSTRGTSLKGVTKTKSFTDGSQKSIEHFKEC